MNRFTADEVDHLRDSNRLPPFSTFSKLLSPPESKPYENFPTASRRIQHFNMAEQPIDTPVRSVGKYELYKNSKHNKHLNNQDNAELPSPPISPCMIDTFDNEGSQSGEEAVHIGGEDPQLFPDTIPSGAIAAEEPLFPAEQLSMEEEAQVRHHMRMNRFKNPRNLPTPDEYRLTTWFKSCIGKHINRDCHAWLAREREYTSRMNRPNRVIKPSRKLTNSLAKIAPAPISTSKKPKVATKVARPRAPRAPKRSPLSRVNHSFDDSAVNGPKQRGTGTSAKDEDFNSLPDYSPPLSSLPNSTCLKADWPGHALDLSADLNRGLLHEAELNLAAKLRLSCATYLCSKRRIFRARVESYQLGKEFRKTDSQQACSIDVNKASKLWQAFDKVKWFEREYFERYL